MQAKPLSFLHVFHHSFVVVMAYLWVATSQSLRHIALMTNAGVLPFLGSCLRCFARAH